MWKYFYVFHYALCSNTFIHDSQYLSSYVYLCTGTICDLSGQGWRKLLVGGAIDGRKTCPRSRGLNGRKVHIFQHWLMVLLEFFINRILQKSFMKLIIILSTSYSVSSIKKAKFCFINIGVFHVQVKAAVVRSWTGKAAGQVSGVMPRNTSPLFVNSRLQVRSLTFKSPIFFFPFISLKLKQDGSFLFQSELNVMMHIQIVRTR